MTNEELIAQARELCEGRITTIKFLLHKPISIESEIIYQQHLNSWTTHLAEIDEHKAIEHCKNPLCHGPVCSKCGSKETLQVSYPCNDLLTKAKRLLGVE